jgi:hypothetical protein
MGTILYIAGTRHCGSTILDLLLGEHPRFASLGQVSDIYRYFDGTEECTCGQALDQCPLWGAAVAALPSGHHEAFRRDGPSVLKERQLPLFVASRAVCRGYIAPYDDLYDELLVRTGADVLVDSSKNITRAIAHVRSSRHRTVVLHLVRDCRGLIRTFSRNAGRRVVRQPMAQWLGKNAAASTALRFFARDSYVFMRYEDLLRDPEVALSPLARRLDLDLSTTADLVRSGCDLGIRHIFRGNPRLRAARSFAIDSGRLRQQVWAPEEQDLFWRRGGFVTSLWGYDRRQTYASTPGAQTH